MTTPATLPATLRDKLAALAHRIRVLRVLRGLSWLVLLLAVPFLGLFLADFWLVLPDETLAVTLPALAGLALVVIALAFVLPLRRRLTPESLAALIEQQYPELAERLTSSVELAQRPTMANGSAALIAQLLEETEGRSRGLSFQNAFPVRPTVKLLTAAAVALLLALLPALLWAEDYGDFSQRLLLSWFAAPPYVLHVQPGDQIVATGSPLTVCVQVQRRDERLSPPAVCLLVHTDAQGNVGRLRMRSDGENAFRGDIPRVSGSLSYRVEAGGTVSDSYTITAVEPVELAASPTCTIVPPPYADKTVCPTRTLQSFTELMALEYGQVRLDCHFTRPAQVARLEVSSAKGERTWALPAHLSEDRKSASVELPTFAAGNYRLTLHTEAEHRITTRQELPGLTLRADVAPLFTQRSNAGDFSGGQGTLDDVLHLKVGAEDDVGLGKAEVEYRVNAGASRFETIFAGEGKLTAEAEHLFRLAGKVKDGDVICYRIRVADVRRLTKGSFRSADGRPMPETDLQPHVIYHPDRVQDQDNWFILKVSAKAEPLQKQDILAQRDQVRQRIEVVKNKLREERAGVAKLREMIKNHAAATPEQSQKLTALRKENRTIQGDLMNLGRDAEAAAEMQALADRGRDIAEGEMVRSDEAMRQAQGQKSEVGREQRAHEADQELAAALQKLDDLQRLNEQFAQDRLDQMRMEQLARQEEDLAKRAADLDEQGPDGKADLAKLRAEQEKVGAELKRLAEQSKFFRDAMNAARAEQADKLAERARKLAQAQRDLAKDEEESRKKQVERALADFARKQQGLAAEASELGRKSAAAAQVVRVQPLRADDARNAVEALKQGQIEEAMRLQDQAAREMERAATDLERAADLGRDPREVVRRLARMQQELEERLTSEASQVARKSAVELIQGLDEIRKAQEAIRQAVEGLDLTGAEQPALKARQTAVEQTARAARTLQRRDPLQAWEEMQEARQALERLAGAMTGKEMPPVRPEPDPADALRRQQAEQARQLARSQKELREALRTAAAPAPTAKEQARQQALQKQTEELAQDLGRMAQSASPQGKESAKEAAIAGEQAQSAMQQARAKDAADMLDKAARQAGDSAKQMAVAQSAKDSPEAEAGRQAARAIKEADQAQMRLDKGEVPGAQASMREAAQAMQQAAKQAGQQLSQPAQKPAALGGNSTVPSQGGLATDHPSLKKYEKELRQYAGRSWGQLPGELRTRIVQDMRGRYGEDYAGIIQRYFEQIADTARQER